jgi:hypothetical protein
MTGVAEIVVEIAVLALAIAASPLPIIPVVLVLGGVHARTSGPAFVLGWVVSLGAIGGVLLLVAPDLGGDDGASWKSWLKVVLGAGLLAAAVWKLRGHRASDSPRDLPAWMRSVGSVAPRRAFLVGLVLGANPKNVLLTAAAVAAILDAELSADGQLVSYVTFVLVASLSVGTPVALFFAVGDRSASMFDALQRWLGRHSSLLAAGILGAIGAKLLYDGVAGLT